MKKSVKDTVREAILPTVTELGYRIWDITFAKVGADYHLEITIDNDAGIQIEDCERVHRAIDPILDEADPIDESYYLECTSPGLEKEIKTDAHIEMCIGEKVELKLYAPKNGAKVFTGALVGLSGEGKVIIDLGNEQIEFEKNEIAKMHTVFEF